MGAGGVGGYYGGRLATAGHEVCFVARGPHLHALRRHGLRVEGVQNSFHLPQVTATDDPLSFGPADLVIVAVKAYDLPRAIESIKPLAGSETTVIPLLNGVDAALQIGRTIAPERVMGGLAYVSASVAEPGVIRQVSSFDRILIGELNRPAAGRGTVIESALRDAGIDARQVDDIAMELWRKYLFIAAASGVAALTGATMGTVLGDPDTRTLFIGCMNEVEALARHQGIDLPENICQETLAFVEAAGPNMKPSMLLDLEQGRPLELDALNGTAARLGRQLGVATPVNQFIYSALKFRAGGKPKPTTTTT